jgi:hypothetical protein
MHVSFVERQAKRAERRHDGRGFLPVGEYLDAARRRSSEARLEALPLGSWRSQLFVAAARHLGMDGFALILLQRDDALPPLGPDVHFKYAHAYAEVPDRIAEGEDLLVAIVMEGDRVVAHGIAAKRQAESEIEIIDFDRRRAARPAFRCIWTSVKRRSASASVTSLWFSSSRCCAVVSSSMRQANPHATSSSPWAF